MQSVSEADASLSNKPKITYLTAGAAGMYCGSCMHDNTLVRALRNEGYEATLIPTYTPIRTDEESVAVDNLFFGGINVYLQQKIPLFRYLPGFLDRVLDNPRIVRRATAKSIEVNPKVLGTLAVSMLKGHRGNQRKEVRRLTHWLKHHERPEILILTNLLIGGLIPSIKKHLGIPVVVTLQGDDVFLEHLPAPYRNQCLELMRSLAGDVDAFITHSHFYRDYMADYLGIGRDKMHVTPLGIDTLDFENIKPSPPEQKQRDPNCLTIGYLARLCPEKGLHLLVDAFIELKRAHPETPLKLLIAGWLSSEHQEYAESQFAKLNEAGFADDWEYLGAVGRQEKLAMLRRLDVACVPTQFQEPKGLYVLEALASGVACLVPEHGAFPELIADVGGGVLFPPNDRSALSHAMWDVLSDHQRRSDLARLGRQAVLARRNSQLMARHTIDLLLRLRRPTQN